MASNAPGLSALIFGATGQTGRNLLREVIESPKYTRVLEVGRRVTPQEQLPANARDKLEQRIINFEKLDDARLGESGGYDVVYVALGTTMKDAGSAEKFEKIDREYVVNAAKAAKLDTSDRMQRLVYVSTVGANPNSYFLYPRSKGLTEQALAELGYQDTIIFHPGVILRSEPRFSEAIIRPFVRVMSLVSSSVGIRAEALGKAVCIAGTLGSDKLPIPASATKTSLGGKEFTVIGNAGSIALAKET